VSKTANAEKLHMSRSTVDRLLSLDEPYHSRASAGGQRARSVPDEIVTMPSDPTSAGAR
jgi:hypothetical protein